MTDPRELSPEKLAAIDVLFDGLPDGYQATTFQLSSLNHAIRETMAKVLQPKLNDYMQNLQPKKLWDQLKLTERVDHLLQDLGLCVSFHGEPALLVSERATGSEDPNQRQYSILVRGKGIRIERELISENIPVIDLMAAPRGCDDLLAPLRKYAYRVGRER